MNKRTFFTSCSVFSILFLAGCNNEYNNYVDNPDQPILPSASEHYAETNPIITNSNLEGFIELTLNDINLYNKTLTRTISNNSSYSVFFNPSAFALEFFYEGVWINIDFSDFLVFTDIAYELKSFENHSSIINLQDIPLEFERGLYRIRMSVFASLGYIPYEDALHHLTAEFELS